MAIARTAMIVSASLAAPTVFLAPPLQTGAGDTKMVETRIERINFSPVGIAGLRIYRDSCSYCHGPNAQGSAAAPQLIRAVAGWHDGAARQFHDNAVASPHRGGDFNEIEMVARYIRELRRIPQDG